MRAACLLLTLLALAACGRGREDIKPDLPGSECVVAPEVQVVTRRVFVSIDPALTAEEPIAEGPIAQCFDVARERRAALERANSKLRRIGKVQGTEVEP